MPPPPLVSNSGFAKPSARFKDRRIAKLDMAFGTAAARVSGPAALSLRLDQSGLVSLHGLFGLIQITQCDKIDADPAHDIEFQRNASLALRIHKRLQRILCL